MAKFITVEHPNLKDKDKKPLRARVSREAFDVAGGFKSKGWVAVPEDKPEKAKG